MSSPYKTVALAGAAGALGAPMLEALLEAGFTVTALTRESSTSRSKFPTSVKIAKVNYDDIPSLTNALKGQDVLISTITSGAIDKQIKLIDAAIEAGVKRIIPSEFGSDTLNANAKQLAVFKDKVATHDYLMDKAKEGSTTYTLIHNNAFLDWGIEHNFLINLGEKKMTLYDGGKLPFSTTTLSSVAKATAACLVHAKETEDRVVRIHDAVITQQQFMEIAQRVVGKDGWTISEVNTAEGVEEANQEMMKGNVGMPQLIAWLARAIYSDGYGGAFKSVDNELLGVEGVDDAMIEEIMRKFA